MRPFRCRCGRIPLRESTLPGQAGWRGRQPYSDADATIAGPFVMSSGQKVYSLTPCNWRAGSTNQPQRNRIATIGEFRTILN